MKRPNDTPHRRAFEKAHGRPPKPGYHIHHIDGNWANNHPSNLLEVTAREHYEIHKSQGDWGACMKLAESAKVSPEELHAIASCHGRKCAEQGVGIHSEQYDHSSRSLKMWSEAPPGRKPVTDGATVLKLKTEEEVEAFLSTHVGWRRGVTEEMKAGLSHSKRRLTSEEARQLSVRRISENNHNFIVEYTCPHCGKQGKGPMMKRWHFENCKHK